MLYLHGYVDYFFHPHLGENCNQADFDFYALDLRKYGRSLMQHQHPNYCKDIEEYFEEISIVIRKIKSENQTQGVFKTYLTIFGKNGISKMVLSTMIPLINSHLKILLSDTCDFDLEMRMNDKSEVEFWMIDCESGIEKPLSAGSGYEKTVSSLALRCVLSKVCSLPKPNIIVFDEVTGKVSNENLDRLGMFFEKLN